MLNRIAEFVIRYETHYLIELLINSIISRSPSTSIIYFGFEIEKNKKMNQQGPLLNR